MPTQPLTPPTPDTEAENRELRARLEEAEDTLRAIRSGEVDALVVSTSDGDQIFTLQGAERSYRTLIEQMNEGALTLTPEGVILYANQRFADMLEMPLEKVIGSPLQDWITAEGQAPLRTLLHNAESEACRVEIVLASGDARRVPVNLSVARLTVDETPSTLGVVASDLTERKRAEEALRESARKFAVIFDDAPIVAMLESYPHGVILDVNQAFVETFGYSREEALGKTDLQLGIQPDPEARSILQIQLRAAGSKHNIETALTTRSGEKRYFRLDAQVVTIDGSRYYLQTAQDITERKAAENEVQELNRVLEARVRSRTTQLEQANKELEAFSYSVSHELRAPIGVISGLSRTVLESYAEQVPPGVREYLDVVCDNARQMGQLLDELLELSRFSQQALSIEEVEPAALVREVIADLRVEEEGRHIDFTIGGAPAQAGAGLPPCRADPRLLKQVYRNLVTNAIKFTRPREVACIEIGTLAQGGEQVYYVKDNGVGFDMKFAGKLFGVFQRMHSDTEFEGTGVGLAIVQRIIRLHEGRIWAEAEPGKGATFYFTLPGG